MAIVPPPQARYNKASVKAEFRNEQADTSQVYWGANLHTDSPLVLLFFLSSLVEPDTIGTMVSGSFLFHFWALQNNTIEFCSFDKQFCVR